ncbi:S8 family serine peptidase [Streptomyces sp. NPDC051940]|uniref:S8 family serine peptidase n=1 Tax=Streptomyces sp. NPDC051940 TaxID=3155675 RepID=UPI00343BC120
MTIRSRRAALPAAAASAALALTLGGGLLSPPPAVAADPAPAAEQAPAEEPSYDITLITGDVVHYTDLPGAKDDVTVDPAPGSRGGVQVQTYGENTYVLPVSAMGLLAAGKLDYELFNVTGLAAMGYDDAHSGGVPVIATAPHGRSAKPPAAPKGAAKVRRLPSINATAMKAGQARAFWKDVAPGARPRDFTAGSGIAKIWLDTKLKADLAQSVPQIGAPAAWAKGYDGTGTKVAVLDTGIDATHPDLTDAVAAERSFVPGESPDDGHGHGTHVASTIAGSGAASGGTKKGVAPGAKLYVGKVLANDGGGTESGVIAGMEWARDQGVDVVSMSIGTSGGSDGSDPVSRAVEELSANGGPLFVVAAGNNYATGTIGSPGAAASALTVGAVSKADARAEFSSQGPLPRTYALKPDVSAPGVAISAAAAHPAAGASMYQSMSGTSMATPHVAGAAAILRQRHPDWDAARIKNALMTTSKKLAYTPLQQGNGRVDVAAAVDGTIEATGSVPTAVFRWPHQDAAPAERTVTYRNTGGADVTLNLATDTADPAYTLSASTLTVPAGGTAAVTLRLDPATVPVQRIFSGQVTAKDAATGALVAHTAFALVKEPELYDYTVKLTGRDGRPAAGVVAITYPGNPVPGLAEVYGSTTFRLPPRTYTTWGFVDVTGDSGDRLGTALLSAPEIDLAKGDAVADLDASGSQAVTATTPFETENVSTVVQYRRTLAGGGSAASAFVVDPAYDSLYVQPVADAAEGGSQDLMVHTRLRQRLLDAVTGSGHDTPLTRQTGSATHEGKRLLKTVYAGSGTPADYAGLDAAGKAVVVDRDPDVAPDARAKAAAEAGAAALITVNDAPGRLYETYTDAHGLTLAGVHTLDGARLVAEAKSGDGTLNLTERRDPAYQYDLVQQQHGAFPGHPMAYAPGHDELARIDTRFHSPWASGLTPAGIGRRVFVPSWAGSVGANQAERYPATRTDYVTAPPAKDGRWTEEHRFGLSGAGVDNLLERAPARTYEAGRKYAGDWFEPVNGPRSGEGSWRPSRTSNGIAWNIPAWSGSGAGHIAFSPATLGDTELRRDGVRITGFGGAGGWSTGLTAEERSYSLILNTRRDTGKWDLTTATHTEWGFRSAAPKPGTPSQEIPLLDVAYDVPVDLNGDVPAGRRTTLGLSAAAYTGGATATSAALQVSYDEGATWQPVTLQQDGAGRWTAALDVPARAGGTVSLKTSAEGPGGLSVTQEVIRAFGLK